MVSRIILGAGLVGMAFGILLGAWVKENRSGVREITITDIVTLARTVDSVPYCFPGETQAHYKDTLQTLQHKLMVIVERRGK